MKKTISLFLVAVMTVLLVACSSTGTSSSTTSTAAKESSNKETTAQETNVAEETSTEKISEIDPSEYTFVIAMPNINHPVHRCVQLGFIEACKKLGYNYQIVGAEGSDINEVTAAAEAAAAAGAKAVILWANDETALSTLSILKNDYSCLTCVPHFQWTQEQAPGLDINLACDAKTYAVEVADYMAGKLEGKTGCIALTQAGYNTNENAASEAFTARIKELQADGKLAGITVLEPAIEGSSDITESTNVDVSIIQANSDIVGAVAWTGNGPVTWSNAARKCGYDAGEIVIISMDYTADNIVELESGYVSALVAQPLYEEAYQAVYDFDKLLRGEPVDYWTKLDAPLMYVGGEGVHDPAYYQDILDRVSSTFS